MIFLGRLKLLLSYQNRNRSSLIRNVLALDWNDHDQHIYAPLLYTFATDRLVCYSVRVTIKQEVAVNERCRTNTPENIRGKC